IINIYGPTEGTINTTLYECKAEEPADIPIGGPLINYRIYILGGNLELLPIGLGGELCIAGEGLAGGYLNQPKYTAQKFIENPHVPGEIIYRTGDLARWREDGCLEFLGRIDFQVKIRGMRVEPEEIENRLSQCDAVKDAAVIAGENKNGTKYLCAYIVTVNENETDMSFFRDYLAGRLPGYMVPAYFIKMEKLPLTIHGKIDRKSLPEPGESVGSDTAYQAPRNDTEVKLSEVWQNVLGVEKVGINHDYFSLGGDSIKAIQVASRMQKYNMKVGIKEIFLYPTIGELSGYIKQSDQVADQGPVEGAVKFTPIQEWFFKNNFTDMHHSNQAVMLFRPGGFNETILHNVFRKILEHHDALRTAFYTEDGRIKQVVESIADSSIQLEVFDLRGTEHFEEEMLERCSDVQSSVRLHEGGGMVKTALFKREQGDYLLIAVHHLVMDTVSWQIMLEDINTLYSLCKRGMPLELPSK
ncbi:MAG: AMP-binding protein, partial [bacterium]|nr:AMP-binding protein [bacterium]